MAKFKTKDGKTWEVDFEVPQLSALRKDCEIDLRDAMKPGGDSVVTALGDPDKFGQLIWIACGEQAEAAGHTPESFVKLFNGKAFRDASAAIWEAIFDFYQGPIAGEKAGRAMQMGMTAMDEKLGEVWDQAGASLISKLSAGNSPAPAALTPAA